MTDDQPDFAAYCLLDDEEEEDGFHKVTILAVDDQANSAVETDQLYVD